MFHLVAVIEGAPCNTMNKCAKCNDLGGYDAAASAATLQKPVVMQMCQIPMPVPLSSPAITSRKRSLELRRPCIDKGRSGCYSMLQKQET